MTKNFQGKNQSSIVFGVLLAVIISVSAIIAYVYFQPSSKSLSQKKIINEIARPASEVMESREVDLAAKDIPSSDLIEDSKVDSKPEEQLNNNIIDRNKKDTVLAFKSSPGINRAGSSSYTERMTNTQGQQRAVSSHESGKTDKAVISGESGIVGSSPMHSSRSVNSSGIETTNTETDPGSYMDNNMEESSPSLDEDMVEADPEDTDPVNAPVSNVSVARFLNSIGNSVAVMLTINVDSNAPNGLIVKEQVLAGWNVSGISDDGIFNSSTGEIKWLLHGYHVRNRSITYKLEQSSGYADGLSINGNYFYKNSDGKNISMETGGADGV